MQLEPNDTTSLRQVSFSTPPRTDSDLRWRLSATSDGRRFALWSIRSVWVFDSETGATIWTSSDHRVSDVGFYGRQDEFLYLSKEREPIALSVQLSTGMERQIRLPRPAEYIAFSPDRSRSALTRWFLPELWIGDSALRETNSMLRSSDSPIGTSVRPVWTSDNAHLVLASTDIVTLVHAQTGRSVKTLRIPGEGNLRLFSGSNGRVVVARDSDEDKRRPTVFFVLDEKDLKVQATFRSTSTGAWAADTNGQSLWIGQDGGVSEVDVRTSRVKRKVSGDGAFVRLGDGTLVVLAEHRLEFIPASIDAPRRSLELSLQAGPLVTSEDGSMAVAQTLGSDGRPRIELLDLTRWQSLRTVRPASTLDSLQVALSRSGQVMAVVDASKKSMQVYRPGQPPVVKTFTNRVPDKVWIDEDTSTILSTTLLADTYAKTIGILGLHDLDLVLASREVQLEAYRKQVPLASPSIEILSMTGKAVTSVRSVKLDTFATALALSLDGRSALVGDIEGRIQVLNLENGSVSATRIALDDSIVDIAFSPEGRFAAILSGDGVMTVVHLDGVLTPLLTHRLEGHGWLKWSRDGRSLAVGQPSGVRLIHVDEPFNGLFRYRGELVAIDDQANLALVKDQGDFFVVDARTREQRKRLLESEPLVGLSRNQVVILEGRLFAMTRRGKVLAWSLDTGARVWETDADVGNGADLRWVVNLATKSLFVVGQRAAIQLSMKDGESLAKFDWPASVKLPISSVAVSTDGALLVASSNGRSAHLFETSSGILRKSVDIRGQVIGTDRDSSFVFYAGTLGSRLLPDGSIQSFYTPSSEHSWTSIHTSSERSQLWMGSTGAACSRPGSSQALSQLKFDRDRSDVLSPSGSVLAIELRSGEATIFRCDATASQALIPLARSSGGSFLANGRLAITRQDGGLAFWDTAASRFVGDVHPTPSGGWIAMESGGLFEATNHADLEQAYVWFGSRLERPMSLASIAEIGLRSDVFKTLVDLSDDRDRRPVLTPIPPPTPAINSIVMSEGALDRVDVTFSMPRETIRGRNAPDLRLLRDGQIVASLSSKTYPYSVESLSNDKYVVRGVRLSRAKGPTSTEFGAFALSAEGVRSSILRKIFPHPSGLPRSVGRLHAVGVGMDLELDRFQKLEFAASDARAVVESAIRIASIPNAPPPNTSLFIASEKTFGKEDVLGAIARLGTRATGQLGLVANPEDTVVLMFSGHGSLSAQGVFSLVLPRKGGPGMGASLPDYLSSNDIATALAAIDANRIVVIIDACHSGAALGQQAQASPGVSLDLGRLALQKNMILLAASDSLELAWQSSSNRQGVLSYGLLTAAHDVEHADRSLLTWVQSAVEIARSRFPLAQRPVVRAAAAR